MKYKGQIRVNSRLIRLGRLLNMSVGAFQIGLFWDVNHEFPLCVTCSRMTHGFWDLVEWTCSFHKWCEAYFQIRKSASHLDLRGGAKEEIRLFYWIDPPVRCDTLSQVSH